MAINVQKTNIRLAGINPVAIAMADKLNDQFFADADEALAAINHTRVMAIIIASDINAIFSAEDISSWPVVNTNKTDDEGYDGNNPDYTKVLDGKKTTRVSFFDTIIDRSKWAVSIKAQIEKVSDALNEKEGCDKELKRMGQLHLTAEKKRLNDKLKDVKNLFRKGVRIVQQRALMEEQLPGIMFEYWTTPAGEIIPSSTPIVLSARGKSGIFQHMGIGSFTSLNVQEALDTLDTLDHEATPHEQYDALIATSKKGADEEEADEDNIEIINAKRFETGAASMLSYLLADKNVSRLYTTIDKAKSIDDHADFLLTLSGLATELSDIAEHFKAKIDKARDIVNEREAA